MKAVVQRVKHTTLSVDGQLISEIPFGLTVFLGVKVDDTEAQADYIAKKIANNYKNFLEVKNVTSKTAFRYEKRRGKI